MSPNSVGPAARDMRIVHSALRRDLERARVVLSEPSLITDRRRRALSEHLAWMMHTLHGHHSGEDKHIWPEIRIREPAAGALLDDMDADHRRIHGPIDDLEAVAASYGTGTASESEVLASLSALEASLLPHLVREEREMMPMVDRTLSEREWETLSDRAFMKSKGVRELAMEGHWVIDNASPDDRQYMLAKLPAVPRFVLLRLMGGPYHRRVSGLWKGTLASGLPPLSIDALNERRS